MRNNILLKFWKYQSERFPIIIIALTTLSVVLSSTKIFNVHISVVTISLALLAGLIYLFHIRVIDEHRDYTHDVVYHQSRPIQTGIITLRELTILDIVAMGILLTIAISCGKYSFQLFLGLLLYSFIAGKNFFLGEKIKKRFFIYNAINLIQLILLQFFIYAILNPVFEFDPTFLLSHLTFIFINSILIEWVRKIKIKKEESAGNDTYSNHLGFNTSMILYIFFVIANYISFLMLLNNFPHTITSIFSSIILLFILLGAIWWHLLKKMKKTENILLVGTLIFYIGLNVTIYLI